MIVRAPGKLVITGAYAVLEGAPAIGCAIDRYALATSESRAIDTRALYDGTTKLGLGSSAACVVVRIGLAAAMRGEDLEESRVRERVFAEARAEHARSQRGGSGVDVAASTFGGVQRYALGASGPTRRTVELPPRAHLEAFFCGVSAKTSDLRGRVDALRARNPEAHAARMRDLGQAAESAATAIDTRNLGAFVEAARATLRGLSDLGEDADAPIVPDSFRAVARAAEAEGAAFLPSGAGGGDVGVYVGPAAPSPALLERAIALGLRPLRVKVTGRGLHVSDTERK